MANKIFHNCLLASVFAVAMITLTQAAILEKPVTDLCMGCICEARSGCNQTPICCRGVCGMFFITRPYWADGGNLTINNEDPTSENAFPNCVNDPYCAANTIQNYMRKFSQDCNGDNAVDCYDYAAIHMLGGHDCQGELSYQYHSKLSTCLNSFGDIDVRSN
ncbi:lysozyme-like [Calliphora vicina]|uniref:lysozyme-like n=1 Tax=Calliphora vicina TaxID=7373 RepID=UPI00325A4FAA